jgi:presenilin-like A22 family membrane protease
MRKIILALLACFVVVSLTGCIFGLGTEVREIPPSWKDQFTNGGANAVLYMVSIIAIAAGIALIVWTPFKSVGLFAVTMFGSIIVLTYVFALILSIMPYILIAAALLTIAYGVIVVRRHNWDVSDTIKDLEDKVKDSTSSEFGKLVEKAKND